MTERAKLSPAIAPPIKSRMPEIALTITGVGVFAMLILITRPIWHTDRGVVEADLGNLVLLIPRDEEFTQIFLSDRDATGEARPPSSVSFEICDQHVKKKPEAGCQLHGLNGTWVRVQRPSVASEFGLLKERPLGLSQPPQIEMISQSWSGPRSAYLGSPRAEEQSALSRVRSPVWGDEPQLSTTDRGWPIADCDLHPGSGSMGCRFGFLIEGTPVVAQWFSPTVQTDVTQAQVWNVASDIDRRVRRLVVSPPRKQS